jgi:uncharacterized protein (DUF2147 family)
MLDLFAVLKEHNAKRYQAAMACWLTSREQSGAVQAHVYLYKRDARKRCQNDLQEGSLHFAQILKKSYNSFHHAWYSEGLFKGSGDRVIQAA